MIIFSPSPHIHTRRSAAGAMIHVIIALLPAAFAAAWFFGLPAIGVMLVSVTACVAFEYLIARFVLGRRRAERPSLIAAALTGLLLALNVPAGLPWWTVVVGALFAIGVAKMAFGGLGCNIFNPAIAARVFLLISFPALMTVWPVPGSGFEAVADGLTGATPLEALKKFGAADDFSMFCTPGEMFMGSIGGSLGEVSALALLIGFVYLLAVRVISWHIPVAIIATVAALDLLVGARVVPNLLGGGLLLGAIFMATDYVTSPMTRRGMLIYGVLIGVVTVVIRQWGAYPEGMSFAILLGNGLTPLINRWCRPVRFGKLQKEGAV